MSATAVGAHDATGTSRPCSYLRITRLAAAAGLSPSRVHQLVAAADLDALDAALGELRAAGWPAPEDPDSDEDTDLDGRDHLAARLSDEVDWLRQCAGWLRQLDGGGYPPAVNLRPAADWPDRAVVAVDLARVRAVIDRIAADVDELARARRVQDLDTAAVLSDRRAERRRRLAEPAGQRRPNARGRHCHIDVLRRLRRPYGPQRCRAGNQGPHTRPKVPRAAVRSPTECSCGPRHRNRTAHRLRRGRAGVPDHSG